MKPYRAIPIDGKDFVYGWYIELEDEHYIIPDTASICYGVNIGTSYYDFIEGFIKVIPETVGQSTGLMDNNGKEDYDGNIWEVEYRGKKHRFSHKSELSWEGYIFSFKCLTGEVSPVHANVEEDGIIIGNVHQTEKPK